MSKKPTSKISVLLADDHVVVREGIRELINATADMIVVAEASDGKEAVDLSAKLKPNIVLMDIAMPEINGIEATREIKEKSPATNVLVLSAYDNEEFVIEVIKARAAGYLLKNVEGADLLSAIRAVHVGDSVLAPGITKQVFTALREEKPTRERNRQSRCRLTERELEVIRLGAEGLTNRQIAEELGLSERTVQTHWRNVYVRIDVCSRVEAIMLCLKQGWITVAGIE